MRPRIKTTAMKNRFNIQLKELSNKLKGHIECIQLWTNLTFVNGWIIYLAN
jgi:hypothetical protein